MEQPRGHDDIRRTYDSVADRYAEEFRNELDGKRWDRDLLDGFAGRLSGATAVAELGCGPGQIGARLRECGVPAFGVDLSLPMMVEGRRCFPDGRYVCADFFRLPFADGALDAVVAFYCIIHAKRHEATAALREWRRVLRPGGRLLLSFHGGEGSVEKEDWFERGEPFWGTFFTADEMAGYAEDAGFADIEVRSREPYEFEYPSERLYLEAVSL